MSMNGDAERRDLRTLAGIVRGPGNYATPSPDRVNRLVARGLVKKSAGQLRPTLKGRVRVWLYRRFERQSDV